MQIGFIGTGAITEAMIEGLCGAARYREPILVTRRSAERSRRLAEKHPNVAVADDARAIVASCEFVVLAVMPAQAEAVLESLAFRDGQHLLSVVAGLRLDTLRRLGAPASVQRALPMPPMEKGLGALPVCPPQARTQALLEGTGDIIAVEDEHQFEALATGSALMASFFAMVARMAAWIERQGVPEREAALYARSVFHGLAALVHDSDAMSLRSMARDSLTAGGINEQVLGQFEAAGWFEEIDKGLDAILHRLEGTGR